ncbi:MAG: hypothetical protein J6C31_00935 [Prevotella sp.]|nr:hypothetical protein [Prevotella sp.]
MESLLTLFEQKDCVVNDDADKKQLLDRAFDREKIELIRKEKLKVAMEYLKKLGV